MQLTRQEILKLTVSLMNLGLMIDLVGAALLFVIGNLIRKLELIVPVDPGRLNLLIYSLIGVSVIELVLVVVLRKRWICAESPQLRAIKKREVLARHLKLLFSILYLVSLTPALYGFLYFILGGADEFFVILLAITMIGYMLIRVRPDDLEKALEKVDLEDPG